MPFLDEYFEVLSDWFNTKNTVLEQFNETGFDYFSVLVNYNATFLFAILGVLLHFIFTWIYNHTDKRMFSWKEKWVVRLYEHMTFGFYIRITLEFSLFMILNSLLETISIAHKIRHKKPFNTWVLSNLFAILALIFYVLFIYFQVIHLAKKNNSTGRTVQSFRINEMNKITHRNHDKYASLYEGLKETHKKRKCFFLVQAFQLIFIMRRVFMIIIIVSFVNCHSQKWAYTQIGFLFTLQLLYMTYILFVHAFTETENNVIEIFNEFIFTFLIIIWGTLPHSREIGENLFIKYTLKEEIMANIVIFSSMSVAAISIAFLN